jgi:alpha-glucosidase
MNKVFLFFCLVAISLAAPAQQLPVSGNIFRLITKDKELRLEFCTPSMFRVRTSWDKKFEEPEPWMVVNYKWPAVKLMQEDQKDFFLLRTVELTVKISKRSGQIEVLDKKGKLLSSELSSGGTGKSNDTVACVKSLTPNEHFFGFGERMDFLDRRSKKLSLNVGRGKGLPHIVGAYNILEANYAPVPFFMSTNGYGIFFHNAYPTEWDMGSRIKNGIVLKRQAGRWTITLSADQNSHP